MELTSISASQFSGNPNLRFLSMGWNDLTDIPAGLFDGLNSLGEIKLYGTALSCSCDSLWFMTYVDSNYLSLFGDIVCNDGDYIGTFVVKLVFRILPKYWDHNSSTYLV